MHETITGGLAKVAIQHSNETFVGIQKSKFVSPYFCV